MAVTGEFCSVLVNCFVFFIKHPLSVSYYLLESVAASLSKVTLKALNTAGVFGLVLFIGVKTVLHVGVQLACTFPSSLTLSVQWRSWIMMIAQDRVLTPVAVWLICAGKIRIAGAFLVFAYPFLVGISLIIACSSKVSSAVHAMACLAYNIALNVLSAYHQTASLAISVCSQMSSVLLEMISLPTSSCVKASNRFSVAANLIVGELFHFFKLTHKPLCTFVTNKYSNRRWV
jgi:hypothetical protein